MPEGKFELSSMELDEISLVPSGDDPLAKVVIAKADTAIAVEDEDEEKIEPTIKLKSKKRGGKPKVFMKDKMITKDVHQETSILSTGSLNEPLSKETNMTDGNGIDKSSLTAEQAAYVAELEEYADMVDSALEEGTLVKAEPSREDSLLSKADPELAEYISKQDARVAELEAREAHREAVSKAATYSNLDTGAIAEILQALPTELVSKVEAVLASANAAAENTAAFVEIGKSFMDSTDADSLGAEAKALIEKNEGLTSEQAMEQILNTDPSRYEALLKGNV